MIATLIFPLVANFPLVPKPTINRLHWSSAVICRIPKSAADGDFKSGRTNIKKFRPPIHFHPDKQEGFRISISPSRVDIRAKDQKNRLMAVEYLARLTKMNSGQLELPSGIVELRPKTSWRGVHLFVGPQALKFHKKLWTRVLLPLGYNKVVLQCEQTEWKSLTNLRGGINMKREDLRKLCAWYRSQGVEVIPLVQSFGHIKWLTNKGANLDLVLNRELPFAVDPRNPKVKDMYTKLWREVIEVTKAKTIHVGLDEVDFRGFPKEPGLLTKLWRIQVPILAKIAKENRVNLMLWGDELIASGEGAAPHRAKTKEEAKQRRSVIPKGTYIADWHYQKDSNQKLYTPSLKLFGKEGFKPIAATWFEPENIQGFNLAAISQKAGTLQTTWAGYESNENVMLKNVGQFSAMVLAADFAWSGRNGEIEYSPKQVLLRLYRD